jgi:hypothetical protein
MRAGTSASAQRIAGRAAPLLPPELIPLLVPLLALGPALLMILVFWAVL